MLRSRRFALIAALTVLTVAGCGDANTTSSGTPPVIKIGAAGSGNAVSAAEMGDRSMIAPYGTFEYVFDGTLPDLGDSAPAWSLPLGAAADTATVRRIADVLGIEGEPRALSADMGGGWMVGAEDYTTANLTVSSDAMLSWWYNPDPSVWETTSVVCVDSGSVEPMPPDAAPSDPAPGTDATTDTVPVDSVPIIVDEQDGGCVMPTPPEGVPTAAEAEANARAMMAELGLDASRYEFDVYADEYNASVTAYLMLNGVRSPLAVSFGYGAEGALYWASGYLAEPQVAGEYPLVDTTTGLARLSDQAWMGFYGIASMARGGAVAAQTAVGGAVSDASGEAAPPSETVVTEPGATPSTAETITQPPTTGTGVPPTEVIGTIDTAPVVIGTVPIDTVPIEPVVFHLTDVRLTLTTVWDVDGAVWLVPAYEFSSTENGQFVVLAVEDGFVELPDPGLIPEPVPAEPTDSSGGGSGGNGGGPGTELPAAVDIDKAHDALVGRTEDEAAVAAANEGWTLRVAVRDGEEMMLTADYSPTRVNLVVEGGVVADIHSIG